MTDKVLVVTDTTPVPSGHGGGVVVWHEQEALRKAGRLAGTIDREKNNPEKFGLPNNPFMVDFLTSTHLDDFDYNALFFNGNGFYNTYRCGTLKYYDQGPVMVIVDVPAHDQAASEEEFKRLGINYPFTHMTNPFLFDKFIHHIQVADLVICPSNYSVEQLTKFGIAREKCVVIPHGCAVPTHVQDPDPEFKVINIGQLGPDKGHTYLWQAWGLAKKSGFKGKLVLAGEGTSQIPTIFGQQPDTEALGYVDSAWRLDQKLWEASVYVQPSVTEGFGIPVLEAMAHARPVIVTSTTGSSELVEDGKSGFVVPPRDPQAIATKILYFAMKPDEVKRMGAEARAVAEQYTWERMEKAMAEKVVAL
jgi:glycosyltransferase involved in cell wall biosynthesis